VLGEYYGEQNGGVKRLIEKCKCYHQKPCNWHLGLDTQLLLLGELPLFDGILNLVTLKFTKYSSDKMCTVKMNMNTTEYSECCTDEDLNEVQRILRQMFQEEALYSCVMSRIALGVIYHRNVHREVLVLYGDGANGKTVLIKIIRMILGDLMTTLSMNVLKDTPDGAGDKPLSWPKMLQSPTLCIVDEMNGNLDDALIKKIRGDDIFESRQQHSAKQNTNSLTAFPILFGNDPPQCPKADQALNNLLIAFHMPSKFVAGEPDPDTEKYEFKMDVNVVDKFKRVGMQVAFMQELSKHLRAYIERGHKHPTEVSEFELTEYLLNEENMTVKDHVWSVVDKNATSEDVITGMQLWEAVKRNGYMHTKSKFTRDTRFLRQDPEIGAVKHSRQDVYRGLQWKAGQGPYVVAGFEGQF
jgi:hypothetical protein